MYCDVALSLTTVCVCVCVCARVCVCVGLGPVIDLHYGLFNTWHHSLHSSLLNRLKRSKHRTTHPHEASLFIIPYDNWLYYVMSTLQCNSGKYNVNDYFNVVATVVNESVYYKRYEGRDHVYIHSAVSDIRASVSVKNTPEFCVHCFKTCYWHQPLSHHTWVSVPFPSMFHYTSALVYTPWDTSRSSERVVLATYLGSIKRGGGRSIRAKIAALCSAAHDCKSIVYKSMSEANAMTNSEEAVVSEGVSEGVKEGVKMKSTRPRTHSKRVPQVLAYYRSVFCLTPPGDDPTRRGLIDALVAGCIPVTFHPHTLLNQMPLHLTMSEAQDIGVYIPLTVLMSSDNLMDILRSIPSEVVRYKQQIIERVAPRLQYSVPPLTHMQSHTNEEQWDPPMDDAVNIMLQGMSTLATSRIRHYNNTIALVSDGVERDMFGSTHPTLRLDLLKKHHKLFAKYYVLSTCNGSQVLL